MGAVVAMFSALGNWGAKAVWTRRGLSAILFVLGLAVVGWAIVEGPLKSAKSEHKVAVACLAAGIWGVTVLAHFLRDHYRHTFPGLLSDRDHRDKKSPVSWVFQHAERRSDKDLPDIIVVGPAATSWCREFESNAERTYNLILTKKIEIGFLFTEPVDDKQRDVMALSHDPGDHASLNNKPTLAVLKTFVAQHPNIADYIRVKRIRVGAVAPMSLYDAGPPHGSCVNLDVPIGRGKQHPVVVVHNIGREIPLFRALRQRIAFMWEMGEDDAITTEETPPKAVA